MREYVATRDAEVQAALRPLVEALARTAEQTDAAHQEAVFYSRQARTQQALLAG